MGEEGEGRYRGKERGWGREREGIVGYGGEEG